MKKKKTSSTIESSMKEGILESKRKIPKDLQRYNKNQKQKNIIIGSIIGIILLIGGITLYKTFALYKEEQSFNVLQGFIPEFSSADIKLAIKKDGVEVDTIPSKDDGTYEVSVECDNGATGSWNYSKWQVEVQSFKKGTKCNVLFTTSSTVINDNPNQNIKKLILSYDIDHHSTNTASTDERAAIFDFTQIKDYQSLTDNNFSAFISVSANIYQPQTGSASLFVYSRRMSYNPANGKLTVYYKYNTNPSINFYDDNSTLYAVCTYLEV